MTPRGLKIRIELPWAFGLIGRLWSRDSQIDAFRVLKTCEAIEFVPDTISWTIGVVVVVNSAMPNWSIAVAIVFGRALGVLLTQLGLFVILRPSGILHSARIWSYVSGYGIFLIGALALILIFRSWDASVWWITGLLIGGLVRHGIEFLFVWRNKKWIGTPFTSSEINFFNAFRLHADSLGIPNTLEVSDSEIERGEWKKCLIDYAGKYPEAVRRFPSQEELEEAMLHDQVTK